MRYTLPAILITILLAVTHVLMLPATAQDLMNSRVDPASLLDMHMQSLEDYEKVEKMLKRYAKGSKYVVRGQVQALHNLESNMGKDREAVIRVETYLRGSGGTLITIMIPYNAPYIEEDWNTVPGKVIQGYPVVVFLNDQFQVLEGNAIFYSDGEYLWRHKRNSLFLHPNYDREWTDENPYEDYVVVETGHVLEWLERQKASSWIR